MTEGKYTWSKERVEYVYALEVSDFYSFNRWPDVSVGVRLRVRRLFSPACYAWEMMLEDFRGDKGPQAVAEGINECLDTSKYLAEEALEGWKKENGFEDEVGKF